MKIEPSMTSVGFGAERALSTGKVVPVSNEVIAVRPQVSTMKQLRIAELQGEKFKLGDEQLIMAIERANRALQGSYTSFEFSIHDKTKEIMVKVLDRETGELIREIPSEKILDMVAKMWEMAGVFIDEQR